MMVGDTFRSAGGIGCHSDHSALNKVILKTNFGEKIITKVSRTRAN